MQLVAFAVFDSKVGAFSQPMFAPTKAAGVRMFANIANDRGTAVGANPEDYTLFAIGSFNNETGVLTPAVALESVCLALSLLHKE